MPNPLKRKTQGQRDFTGMIRSARGRPHRFAFLRKRWVIISLVVLLLVGGVAGYGAYRYFSLQGNIQDEELPPDDVLTPPGDPDVDPPVNVLLVGSDSREGLTEEEQEKLAADDVNPDGTPIGGERADSLVLAHVDPETDHVTMIQFPRDLWVPVADGGKSKINESLEKGNLHLLNTVRELTDLPIHHFVKVNIAGFRDVVDAIGGVEVCIAEPIPFDPQTGIEVPPEEVGMVEFDGDRALRFVRSRAFATGDFERIQNQQKFLAAAIDKVTSVETLLQPSRLLELAGIAEDNVELDAETTISQLYDILQRFRSFNPDDYEAYTVPNLGVGAVDIGGESASIVQPDYPAMKVMFDAIEENKSPGTADGVPDVKPTSISVAVYNGTDVDGAADRAADELITATTTADGSIDVETIADADRKGYQKTVVTYADKGDARQKAKYVAAAIPGAKLKEGKTTLGIDVAVTIGKKFKTKKITQIVPIPIPQPGELPEECQ